MRSRYVKKCKCDSNPVVTKKTVVLQKGVLDIEVIVACPMCERFYKEVGAKSTRMENPDILVETSVNVPLTGAKDELNGSGELQQDTESKEGDGKKEEPSHTAPKEKVEITESEDEGRDADECIPKDKVEEEKKPGRGRPPGKTAGDKPVYERTTGEALKDSGVPEGDLF